MSTRTKNRPLPSPTEADLRDTAQVAVDDLLGACRDLLGNNPDTDVWHEAKESIEDVTVWLQHVEDEWPTRREPTTRRGIAERADVQPKKKGKAGAQSRKR